MSWQGVCLPRPMVYQRPQQQMLPLPTANDNVIRLNNLYNVRRFERRSCEFAIYRLARFPWNSLTPSNTKTTRMYWDVHLGASSSMAIRDMHLSGKNREARPIHSGSSVEYPGTACTKIPIEAHLHHSSNTNTTNATRPKRLLQARTPHCLTSDAWDNRQNFLFKRSGPIGHA